MTQKGYEQKRRECWEEYKRQNLDGEVQWRLLSRYDVYCAAFDRAFDLGKEKDLISQEEINDEAKNYIADGHYNTDWERQAARDGFVDGVNFALGKQEKDADTVIQGWVARDKDGDAFLYQNEPDRNEIAWNGYMMHSLPITSFPDLTWDNSPQPVEIIIKRKKK